MNVLCGCADSAFNQRMRALLPDVMTGVLYSWHISYASGLRTIRLHTMPTDTTAQPPYELEFTGYWYDIPDNLLQNNIQVDFRLVVAHRLVQYNDPMNPYQKPVVEGVFAPIVESVRPFNGIRYVQPAQQTVGLDRTTQLP